MKLIDPKVYRTRTLKKFAWIPVRVGFDIRWLRKVKIKQKQDYITSKDRYELAWHNLYFLDY